MRVKVKRKEGESLIKFLRRFLNRVHKSGIVLEYPKHQTRLKKINERVKWERKMYRLKIQYFVKQKLKEGWDFKKALDMAKRYVQYIKYPGGD